MNTSILESEIRISGAYRISAVNVRTGEERTLADWFENLVTTSGLNQSMTLGNLTAYCMLGTGSTPPTVGDVTLQTQLASTNTLSGAATHFSSPTSPYYNSYTRSFQFAAGSVTGLLREIGMGWDGTHTFSRTLIKDSNGVPTALEILADESLLVTYELRQFPPLPDSVSVLTLNGVDYTVTRRAASVTDVNYWSAGSFNSGLVLPPVATVIATDGTLGAITANPSGSNQVNFTGGTIAWEAAYVADSLTRTWKLTAPPTVGNLVAGISTLLTQSPSIGSFQYSFSPAIPKTATKTLLLSLGVSVGAPT